MDPFDFNLLKRNTPKYLGLESLKEALVPSNDSETQSQDSEPENADVSMHDQIIEEEVNEPFEPSSDHLEMQVDDLDQASAPPDNEAADEHPNNSITHTSPKDTSPSEALDQEGEDHSKLSVLSPTQIGASYALEPLPQNSYKYEIHMPIPTPWNENIPYIFSTYLQLGFNFFILAFIVWIFYVFKRDVSLKIQERTAQLVHKAAWCHEQYINNNCHPGSAVPYLQANQFCLEMEKCMAQDPENVRWLSMHASLLAEVINELIEPLTMQTICTLSILVVIVGLSVFGINYLFGFIRARSYYASNSSAIEGADNSDSNSNQKGDQNLYNRKNMEPRTVKISAISGPSKHIWN